MIVTQTLLVYLIYVFFIYLVCVPVPQSTDGVQRSSEGAGSFSLFTVGDLGNQTQVGLGCKHLYLLVHLPGPLMSLKSYHWGIISAL